MTKYYLISDESVSEIRKALEIVKWQDIGARNHIFLKNAIHKLNAGLHTTDTIPSDYEKAKLSEDITEIVLGKTGKDN